MKHSWKKHDIGRHWYCTKKCKILRYWKNGISGRPEFIYVDMETGEIFERAPVCGIPNLFTGEVASDTALRS